MARTGKFSTDDLAYLTGLAGQLAVAIERTLHFEDLQRAYESLQSTQKQLVRSERLKALGEMAAGVAHDFNNSLSVILGRAEFLLRRFREEAPVDPASAVRDLEAIRTISKQAAETIHRIQDFTRIRKDTPAETWLAAGARWRSRHIETSCGVGNRGDARRIPFPRSRPPRNSPHDCNRYFGAAAPIKPNRQCRPRIPAAPCTKIIR